MMIRLKLFWRRRLTGNDVSLQLLRTQGFAFFIGNVLSVGFLLVPLHPV